MRFNTKQLFFATAIIALFLLLIHQSKLLHPQLRYPHGGSYVKDGNGNVANIQWTRIARKNTNDLGDLLYALTLHPELSYTITTIRDGSQPEINHDGVFQIAYLPDTIWINGKPVAIPKNFSFFAIRKDGTVCPIEIELERLDEICISGQHDPKLMQTKILPAIYGNQFTSPKHP